MSHGALYLFYRYIKGRQIGLKGRQFMYWLNNTEVFSNKIKAFLNENKAYLNKIKAFSNENKALLNKFSAIFTAYNYK